MSTGHYFDFETADFEQYEAVGLYAPGGYTCTCSHCGKSFVGHKRAMNCFQCAGAQASAGHDQ